MVSKFDKGRIIGMYQAGLSKKEIGRRMQSQNVCVASHVRNVIKRFEEEGNVDAKPGRGRKRKTSEREDREIVRAAVKRRRVSAQVIKAETKLQVSLQTIRNRLHEAGLYGRVAVKKAWVREANRIKRLRWAHEHLDWTVEQWSRILWTDESPFVLRWKGRQVVWRRPAERFNPECMQGTIKHDKKINVWSCFCASGVGAFYRVRGILEKEQMCQILIHYGVPSGKRLLGNDLSSWYFQQENDPKHTSHRVQNYIKNKKLQALEWPAQSPDLNPIENLWSILNFSTKDRAPQNEEELFEILEEAWDNVGTDLLEKLVESMPTRYQAVIDNNGWPTRF